MQSEFEASIELIKQYLPSIYGGWRNRKRFDDLETYCMFIGYSRSGHTLIGALLNAHPEAQIAHELNALQYIRAGYSKTQLYYLLLQSSQRYSQMEFKLGGYFYPVPNQSPEKANKLKVIGDKRGAGSTKLLHSHPQLLQRLFNTVDIKIKFIHIIRNPYDNISTRWKKHRQRGGQRNINSAVEHYFSLCEAVADIKKRLNTQDLFELKHELFIENPKTHLKSLCHFLELDAPPDYLENCASIVYQSPHKSRFEVEWSPEVIEIVKNRIEEFPFLQGYSYDE